MKGKDKPKKDFGVLAPPPKGWNPKIPLSELKKKRKESEGMFICDNCKEVSAPGEKAVKAITETRPVTYEKKVERKRGETKILDAGGIGFEPVKEMTLCEKCAREREEASS